MFPLCTAQPVLSQWWYLLEVVESRGLVAPTRSCSVGIPSVVVAVEAMVGIVVRDGRVDALWAILGGVAELVVVHIEVGIVLAVVRFPSTT